MKKAVQFSGGKDSVVCLHMFRNEPDIIAIYTNTGNAFPHVVEYVHKTCEEFNVPLVVARPEKTVMEWHSDNGLPADIVPWDSVPFMRAMSKNDFGATLVPYMECCRANIFLPMNDAVIENNITVVIRGSKECDNRVGVPDGYIDNGIEYHSPLWDWSDEDVFEYIAEHNLPLLDNYKMPHSDSLDCWNCTAHMGKTGAARVEYLREKLPEHYPEVAANISLVKSTVQNAFAYYYEDL